MPSTPASSLSFEVMEADTAVSIGSGDVPVLATPRVLAMLEAATVKAASHLLGESETSVGTEVTLRHLLPTPVGRRVTADAELTAREGRVLIFSVKLVDGDQKAAEGQIQRTVVDRSRFLAKLDG